MPRDTSLEARPRPTKMPSVGPQLPPELQKRKRSTDEDDEEGSSSDSSTGPLPQRPGSGAQSPSSAKRSRVLGPTLPPAPLDERPSSPPQPESDNGSESSDDDDFGDDFDPCFSNCRNSMHRSMKISLVVGLVGWVTEL